LIKWWNSRKTSDVAWKVKSKDLNNWDLDIKNPNIAGDILKYDIKTIFDKIDKQKEQILKIA